MMHCNTALKELYSSKPTMTQLYVSQQPPISGLFLRSGVTFLLAVLLMDLCAMAPDSLRLGAWSSTENTAMIFMNYR